MDKHLKLGQENIKSTYQSLKEAYRWEGMHEDVIRISEKCVEGQKF